MDYKRVLLEFICYYKPLDREIIQTLHLYIFVMRLKEKYKSSTGHASKKALILRAFLIIYHLEAPPRFELGNKGFADLCLTAWLWRLMLNWIRRQKSDVV